MGSFSWFTCDNNHRIRNGSLKPVYLLIPKEFGGGYIEEPCYEGYGRFGGKDVYDLVTEWNRKYLDVLLEWPNWKCEMFEDEEALKYVALAYKQGGDVLAQTAANQLFNSTSYMRRDWKRCIGIRLACYDEDNARLPYPIKIAGRKSSVYEECEPSKKDPNQGF